MKEILSRLVEQNELIIGALQEISYKLDTLEDIKFSVASVNEELQWHKDLSTARQIISAVEGVACAVSDLSTDLAMLER